MDKHYQKFLVIVTTRLNSLIVLMIQSVYVTPPKFKDTVAVIGPRKLGLLIVACLNYYRTIVMKDTSSFRIIALSRHQYIIILVHWCRQDIHFF
jgi:hypothetical protein